MYANILRLIFGELKRIADALTEINQKLSAILDLKHGAITLDDVKTVLTPGDTHPPLDKGDRL